MKNVCNKWLRQLLPLTNIYIYIYLSMEYIYCAIKIPKSQIHIINVKGNHNGLFTILKKFIKNNF